MERAGQAIQASTEGQVWITQCAAHQMCGMGRHIATLWMQACTDKLEHSLALKDRYKLLSALPIRCVARQTHCHPVDAGMHAQNGA
eukprot:1158127-Pelagomonas_calceolata.AAC.14